MSKDLTNAIRALAMDAVQAANSGHPGMPMGMAEVALALWGRHLRHNPSNPKWVDRDRFVVSNGHGSMLLYALLHLTGYDLPMDELRHFRSLHSRTPGHPEYGLTPGVETTTGPLGQGLANAVGMALAERLLAVHFNRPGFDIVNHHTYVTVGDGCLMEGISHEACSLAGTLSLGKLIVLYDDNKISIDGEVKGWFRDDTPGRFQAYRWHVIPEVDGHDVQAMDDAIRVAKDVQDRPSLICCKTVIGKGSPHRAGTAKAHGEALGADEVAATRAAIGWPYPAFVIPPHVYAGWDARPRGAALEKAWNEKFAAYERAHPELAREFRRRVTGQLPSDWKESSARIQERTASQRESVATRKASLNVLEGVGPLLPELVGGSADLTGSNLTQWSGAKPVGAEGGGSYIHYGVREFGMSAAVNGFTLHGGFIAFGGTFLTFSDYSRNALRMAALMRIGSIFVFTHDSIGLGEDGPTHQSVEHISSLRLIPGMDVWRPCDGVETIAAWIAAIERRDGPSSLLFTRQSLPCQNRDPHSIAAIRRGGYVLSDAQDPKAIIIATGSEVPLAMEAKQKLAQEGVPVRVVSMPCTQAFDRQPPMYRDVVLIPTLPLIAVEAGISDFWRKYVGLTGAVIGIDRYGESAPGAKLFEYFGFTAENVVKAVKGVLR
jgi:transketolase